MTRKLMVFLTASLLSVGILTGCSGNSGASADMDNNNVSAPADTQQSVTDDTDDSDDSFSYDNTSGDSSVSGTASDDSQYISEDEAADIALAQVDGAAKSDLRIHKDTDDGRNIYEVSILYNGTEYDFEIDAISGEIIKQENEQDDDAQNGTAQTGNLISEKKAGKIALKKVEGATDSDLRIHMDTDDGKTIYEGSIVYNEMEYEFEIDAVTGDIIEWDSESVYDD